MWDYLTHPALRTRYAVVAALLQESPRIVEIGGYKTPITQFMDSRPREIVVIDPLLDESGESGDKTATKYIHLKMDFSDFDTSTYLDVAYDVVFLGLDMHSPDKTEVENVEVFAKFIDFCSRAKSVFIEYPIGWNRAKRQCDTLLSILKPHIIFDCTMDFSASPIEAKGLEGSQRAGRLLRRLIQFDQPEIIPLDQLLLLVARNLYGSSALSLAKRVQASRTVIHGVALHQTQKHNNTPVEFVGDGISFSTPPSAWSYACEIPVHLPENLPHEELLLEITVTVTSGILAVGILTGDNKTEIMSETLIRKTDADQRIVHLSVPNHAKSVQIICRTGPDNQAGIVKEMFVELCHFKPHAKL